MSESVVLSPRLDLSAASDLKTELLQRSGQDVTLDFSNVKFLGTLCLQVIIAAARGAAAHGNTVEIINVSDRVNDQMKMAGICQSTLAEGMQ